MDSPGTADVGAQVDPPLVRAARVHQGEGKTWQGFPVGGSVASARHDEVRDYGFADQALALRERAGLTQGKLAALLGVSVRAISAWEAGESYPGAERLRQLGRFYPRRRAFA